MDKLKREFGILLRGYKIIFSIDNTFIPLCIFSAVLEAVYPFIIIYMGAEILNGLSSGGTPRHLYFLLGVTLLTGFIVHQVKQYVARTVDVKYQMFERKFAMFLSSKTLDMDYTSIENPETHMKRQRIDEISSMGGGGIWKLVHQSREAVGHLFTIIASVAVTYRAFTIYGTAPQNSFAGIISSPICSIILLFLIVVNTLISIRFTAIGTVKSHKTWDEVIPQNRLFTYILGNYLNSYHTGKDIRLYDQKNMIMENFKNLIANCQPTLLKMERYQSRYANINTAFSSIISLAVYIFIGIKALSGLIGLGDLFKYINGITQFNVGLNGFLNAFNVIKTNNQYLEVLYEFLDTPSASYQGTLTTEKRADSEYELEFHNVSFKYPGTNFYALENINLKFNIGQRMAVVGMNGSGKTTMIKLLCRLYDPTEGVITLNGIDIKKYDYEEYSSVFSVVFQDFKLFSFPLGQNVAAAVEYDCVEAEESLKMAGLSDRLKEMKKGLNTPLYMDFEEDGVEISGGEAQKIAIARALYKSAPFIILDEPTAALDPMAEFEIYSKFNEIVGEKTAVYISHRLSSCKFCNDIAVFHEGKLIQRGNHQQLLADDKGKYYQLWNAQAQYYTE